ncbi:MAG: alpha/beta fold hydrolase [Polyangiaceae bacterium]
MSDTYEVSPFAEPYRAVGSDAAHPGRATTGVALLHGITGNPCSLRPLAELLVSSGFRVDLPRLPGHGTHPKDMARTRYADWRAEALATVDRLAASSARVVLVGLSMGGALALDVASSGERAIAGVVSINAQLLDRGGVAVKLAPLLEHVLPLAPAKLAGLKKDDIARPGVTEHAYDWMPTAAGNSFLRELPRIREQLARLRCPLLVARAPQDHSVPPANSLALLELVPKAKELVLERSYHVATLDYDLELLARHVVEFSDELVATQ